MHRPGSAFSPSLHFPPSHLGDLDKAAAFGVEFVGVRGLFTAADFAARNAGARAGPVTVVAALDELLPLLPPLPAVVERP